ncbi:MAG TPA: glycosyltransferase family A protein [Dongiaceae bacterium]|nr:glycosyltransferase family A protein [Dongiaceae bacterium]
MDGTPEERSEPILSIIIPAYNVSAYIEEAIDSALAQTLREIEVIVVNDGSTDHTAQMIERVVEKHMDPRLKILHRANGGLAAARNTGVVMATGKYIGFLDGDDIWLPHKAQAQISLMELDPGIGISFSNSQYMLENGVLTENLLQADKLTPSFHDMIRRNHIGNGSAPIVRAACFQQAGRFNEALKSCEDYEMWCRILWLTEFRAVGIDQPLTLYRIRDTSLSFNFEKFLANADLAMAALRAQMKNVPERVFRAAHAEHYRIAAWKAGSTQQDAVARRLLMKAVMIWPWLILSDWRVTAVAVALLIPRGTRAGVIDKAKSLRQDLAALTQ